MTEREQSTQGLKSWWKSFSQRQPEPSPPPPTLPSAALQSAAAHPQPPQQLSHRPPAQPSFRHTQARPTSTPRVFGAPLARVLEYASQQIRTVAPDGSQFIWGEVPIVVARCGGYLKTKTDIEGLFRVSGSEKRMRELQAIFDDSPGYGIDLDWKATQFTPHDIATIFRRYLTQMPEPVIPSEFYQKFRDVFLSAIPTAQKLREFKALIVQMPRPNQYLLLYVLDLLGAVAKDSETNRMTSPNLAVIFQPGILHHQGHDMAPRESAISRDTIELLIENQQSIVLSMTATKSGSDPPAIPMLPPIPTLDPESFDPACLPLPSTPPWPSSTFPLSTSPVPTSTSISPAPTSTSPLPSGRPEGVPETIHEDRFNGAPGQAPAFGAAPPGGVIYSPVPTKAPGHGAAAGSPSSYATPVKHKMRRGEPGYMAPSDSDEEAPPGGYYVVESSPRAASPSSPPPPISIPSHETTIKSLFMPPRPSRALRRDRPPDIRSDARPSIEFIDPSDSDDEQPAGGYLLFENKRPSISSVIGSFSRPRTTTPTSGTLSSGGQPPSASGTPTAAGAGPRRSPAGSVSLQRSRTAHQAAEDRTDFPKPAEGGGGATGLLRRRTLPSKRVSNFTARVRRAVREA